MIRNNDPELSFVDAALVLIEREWKSHWLRKLLDLVDWRPFDRQFKKLYAHNTGRPVIGIGCRQREFETVSRQRPPGAIR